MNIKLHNYSFIEWIGYYCGIEKYGVIGYLDELLHDLDCSRLCKGQQIITVNCFSYENYLEQFYRTHAKLTNYILANEYYDKLVKLHESNLEFEEELRSNKANEEKPKKTSKKSPKIKNEFIQHKTKDIFTGKTIYIYDNLKTGESFTSENPNLLENLNNKSKKEKVKKHIELKDVHITFNFNKK